MTRLQTLWSASMCPVLGQDSTLKVPLSTQHSFHISFSSVLFPGTLSSPLSNFEIRVGILTDHKQNPLCGDRVRQLDAGEVWTAECKPPIPGRYVSVSMVGKGYLAICEVAVFARLGEYKIGFNHRVSLIIRLWTTAKFPLLAPTCAIKQLTSTLPHILPECQENKKPITEVRATFLSTSLAYCKGVARGGGVLGCP